MPPNPPQTLSVKRKRNDFAPDTLIVDGSLKRQKSSNEALNNQFAWHRVSKPGAQNLLPPLLSPALADRPKFHLSYASGDRKERVLVQTRREKEQAVVGSNGIEGQAQELHNDVLIEEEPPRPRKRPGAGTAVPGVKPTITTSKSEIKGPSDDDIKQLERFSKEVELDEAAKLKLPSSPKKFKPKVPALRYKERHPEKAAALDPDAMDVDDYVYDTYVREAIVPDAQGKLPEPQGTVGVIVLKDEDEDWWNGEDGSDKEFDTDDEDENAEDYYANDYPEDEVDSDDEYDRNPYQSKFRHGSDDEEFDLNDDSEDDEGARSDGNEDDEHFRRIAPPQPRKAPAYWGRVGEI
ncbi:hypothetical protein CC80DRAFT_488235 [Byssothecium circinans]|uniref:Transcription factor Iwr1 domain-containing protein n=1 Tax=Byssothecium circinans TaxID=147558 RepID=A0A6A5UAA3_9PLEO|nr:hypothetical protein CC80DRAFT_488235 [Byssothecium circinans]